MKKYICSNCTSIPTNKDIDAMRNAGFELRHIECPQCGKQELVTREPIK